MACAPLVALMPARSTSTPTAGTRTEDDGQDMAHKGTGTECMDMHSVGIHSMSATGGIGTSAVDIGTDGRDTYKVDGHSLCGSGIGNDGIRKADSAI